MEDRAALMFWERDIHEGLGMRQKFREDFAEYAENLPRQAANLLPLIPEYGRWDDLLAVSEKNALWPKACRILSEALDEGNLLAAKWAPSINASSAHTRHLAKRFCDTMIISYPHYQKRLSELREQGKVIERLISEGRFNEIDYGKIPKGALKRYDKLLRKDHNYLYYLDERQGKRKELELDPVKLTKEAMKAVPGSKHEAQIDAIWRELPRPHLNTYPVIGLVSPSLFSIAIAFGVYCAECSGGKLVICFDDGPSLINIDTSKGFCSVARYLKNSLRPSHKVYTAARAYTESMKMFQSLYGFGHDATIERIVYINDCLFGTDNKAVTLWNPSDNSIVVKKGYFTRYAPTILRTILKSDSMTDAIYDSRYDKVREAVKKAGE